MSSSTRIQTESWRPPTICFTFPCNDWGLLKVALCAVSARPSAPPLNLKHFVDLGELSGDQDVFKGDCLGKLQVLVRASRSAAGWTLCGS